MRINFFQTLFFLTLVAISCTTAKLAVSSPVKETARPKLLFFSDSFLVNKYPSHKGAQTVLRPESVIKSIRFKDSTVAFNLGLIDFKGDGLFTDPAEDMVVLTNYENYQVRINYTYGTPHCKIKDSVYISVDTAYYLLYGIKSDGNSAKMKRIYGAGTKTIVADLQLKTSLKGIRFSKYTGGEIMLDSVISRRPYTYVYFWNSHTVEYQLNKIEDMYRNNVGQISVIGVHCKEHELDAYQMDAFVEVLAKPWNGYYCTDKLYNALDQEYSFYRGILVGRNGTILFPHISPKELEIWLQQHEIK